MTIAQMAERSMQWCLNNQMDEDVFFAKWSKMLGDIREKRRNSARRYRQRFPEKARKQLREYYHKNADHCRRYARLAREKRKQDPERLEKYRKWCRDMVKKRKQIDPVFKIHRQLRGRILGALNRGVAKSGRTVELLGCPVQEFLAYIESKWSPGMSWDNYGKLGWHFDHIKPCASFDLTNPEEQKKCFHYTNIQPMWAKENLCKGTKQSPTMKQMSLI